LCCVRVCVSTGQQFFCVSGLCELPPSTRIISAEEQYR
jgi:hypothetical protein